MCRDDWAHLGSQGAETATTMNMESALMEMIVQRGRKAYREKSHNKGTTANCDKGY